MGRAVAQERAKLLEEEQRRERAEEAAAQAQAAAALAQEEVETREAQLTADRRKYPVQEMRERVQELEAEVERLRKAALVPPPLAISEPASPRSVMATQQLSQIQAMQTLAEQLKVARLAEVCALLRGEVVQSPVRDQNKM